MFTILGAITLENQIENGKSIISYPVSRIGKDAVYEIADELLRHKVVLEQHLFGRERQLFPDRQSLYIINWPVEPKLISLSQTWPTTC